MKSATWQNPGQLIVAQDYIINFNLKWCGIEGSENWQSLESALNGAISMLSEKYGKPEEMAGGSNSQASPEEKFLMAAQGTLDKKLAFSTSNGYVEISAKPSPTEQGKAAVSITYIDLRNMNASQYSCSCIKIDDIPCLAEYPAVEKLFKERDFSLLTSSDKFKFWMGDFDTFGKSLFIVGTDSDNYVTSLYIDISECDSWQPAKKGYSAIRDYLQSSFAFYDEEPLEEAGATDAEMFLRAKSDKLQSSYHVKRKDGNIVKLFFHSGFLNQESAAIMIEIYDN